jgi:hypothetical protein
MTLLLTALGLFYVFAAAMVLRRARYEWALDTALEKITGKPEPDRDRVWYMGGCALLYGGAGLALVLRSAVAVWLLGAGLLVQAAYYGFLAPHVDGEKPGERARWRKIWNAGIFSTAAFALAAYGLRVGVLA